MDDNVAFQSFHTKLFPVFVFPLIVAYIFRPRLASQGFVGTRSARDRSKGRSAKGPTFNRWPLISGFALFLNTPNGSITSILTSITLAPDLCFHYIFKIISSHWNHTHYLYPSKVYVHFLRDRTTYSRSALASLTSPSVIADNQPQL